MTQKCVGFHEGGGERRRRKRNAEPDDNLRIRSVNLRMLAERVERQKLDETILFLRVRRGVPIKRNLQTVTSSTPRGSTPLASERRRYDTLNIGRIKSFCKTFVPSCDALEQSVGNLSRRAGTIVAKLGRNVAAFSCSLLVVSNEMRRGKTKRKAANEIVDDGENPSAVAAIPSEQAATSSLRT